MLLGAGHMKYRVAYQSVWDAFKDWPIFLEGGQIGSLSVWRLGQIGGLKSPKEGHVLHGDVHEGVVARERINAISWDGGLGQKIAH